jgi:hypothetical protein
MNWRALIPLFVDVIAHVLNELRNEMRANGLVGAALDLDARRAKIARKEAYPIERLAMETKHERGAKLERASLQSVLNCLDTGVILPKPIPSFRFGLGFRVGDERRL